MKYKMEIRVPGEIIEGVEEIAKKEGISNAQAAVWIMQFGLKAYDELANGKQTKLQAARLHGDAGKKERTD